MVPAGKALILNLPRPIAVVAHDAGAANIIIPWIAREPAQIRPVMQGPAEALWHARFPEWPLLSDVAQALAGAGSLLSGTGWASDLEHVARLLARSVGIPSAAVIDHWLNYPERFERRGQCVLPDEIWVTDDEALRIAGTAFPCSTLRLTPNLYLEEEAAHVGSPSPGGDILFVAEPMRGDWGRGREGEFQALDYFLAHRHALGISVEMPIRLRPHPSDPPGKYDSWLEDRNHPVSLDLHESLSAAIAPAEWVVGCQSMALVVALAAGRRCVSVLPPWAPPCALPHKGLLHLRTVVREKGTYPCE